MFYNMPHVKESQQSSKNTPGLTGNDTDRKHTVVCNQLWYRTEHVSIVNKLLLLLSGLFLIDHLVNIVVFIAIAHAQAEEQHRLRPNCRP